jgi:hypothetical protein
MTKIKQKHLKKEFSNVHQAQNQKDHSNGVSIAMQP